MPECRRAVARSASHVAICSGFEVNAAPAIRTRSPLVPRAPALASGSPRRNVAVDRTRSSAPEPPDEAPLPHCEGTQAAVVERSGLRNRGAVSSIAAGETLPRRLLRDLAGSDRVCLPTCRTDDQD